MIDMQLFFDMKEHNPDILTKELVSQVPRVTGMGIARGRLYVVLPGDEITKAEADLIEQVVLAHDPTNVSDEQQLELRQAAYNVAPELSINNLRLLLLELAVKHKSPLADAMLAAKTTIDEQYPLANEAVAPK